MFRLRLLLLLVLLTAKASGAATLFGVVSDRAAPMVAEAARAHLAAHPGDRLILRTPAQFMAASERDARRWLAEADAVLAVAMFGDPATWLALMLLFLAGLYHGRRPPVSTSLRRLS